MSEKITPHVLLRIGLLCICMQGWLYVSGNSLDSLSFLINSSQDQDSKLKNIILLLGTDDIKVLPLIERYKNEALQICKENNSEDCFNDIYNTIVSRLVLFGESKKARSYINEWLHHSEQTQNVVGIARSKIHEANLLYDEGAHDFFLSNLQAARSILIENDVENSIIHEIDNRLAVYHRDIGEYDKARTYYTSSLNGAIATRDTQLLTAVYSSLGRLYRKLSVYDTAKIYYNKSLDIALELNNLKNISGSYNNLGNIYHIEGSLEKALEYYIKSKNAKETINYPKGICIAYHNIGAVRLDLKQYKAALKDFNKSLEMSYSLDNKSLQVHNLLKIGNVYRSQDDIANAIENHKSAKKIATSINYEQGIIESHIFLGEDYLAKEDFSLAFDFLKKGLSLAELNNRKYFISGALVHIAECYMGLQELNEASENPTENNIASNIEIEDLLTRGVGIAKEIDSFENIITSLEALRKFYRTQSSYKKEAEISETYLTYRDSLYKKQSANAIAEWSTKYETKEKEKEIALLQKENEVQQLKSQANRNRFVGIVIFLLLASIAFLTTFYLNHKVKRAKQIESLRTKISSDLHDDVGSILSGLSMQAELLEMSLPEAEKPKLQSLAKLGRTAMHHMRDAVWAMDARKDTMNDLIDRMNEFAHETLGVKGIEYEFKLGNINAEKKIRPDHRQNIYLIYKEAITNILKHSNATMVKLNILNEKGSFRMQIIDNGIVETKTYKTTGLGTDNMKMRAKRIDAIITFTRDQGFGVHVEIPAI